MIFFLRSGTSKYTTDGITYSSGTCTSSTKYGLGYDTTNGLFISCNDGASGDCLETTPTGATGTARSNGGASGLPPTSYRGLAISSGGVTLCLITGGTNISRATNGTTYTYNTAPFTLSDSSILTRLDAAGLFMLYDYSVSTTTYYTSATGATGSWTSRTLPFVPENGIASNLTRAAGKVWIKEYVDYTANGGIGRLAYTTDGINWTTVAPQYSISAIAGGYSNLGANSNKQQAHDAGEPYLMVQVARLITTTGRVTQLQEQLGWYATTDGITLLALPWSMSAFDGLPGIMLDATTGVYSSYTNGVWQKYTIDSATKSLPFHESHIMKVL